jgi:hypothetical protein
MGPTRGNTITINTGLSNVYVDNSRYFFSNSKILFSITKSIYDDKCEANNFNGNKFGTYRR